MSERRLFSRSLIGKLELRDVVALLLFLSQIAMQWVIGKKLAHNETAMMLVRVAYVCASIAFTSFMYRDKLGRDWKRFCSKLWLNIPITVGGGLIMLYVLLPLTRRLLGFNVADESAASILLSVADEDYMFIPDGGVMAMMLSALLASIPVILAPFMEEIVFRHVFFYKWRDGKAATIIMILVSSFLFGAVHIGNFSGNFIQTIPYMFMGLCFALIYLFTGSAWCNIGAHFVFNFINSAGMILWSMIVLGLRGGL